MALLLLSFMDQGQLVVLSGRQFRGFDQYTLDMFVALFGKRCSQDLVGGALFLTAEPAITPYIDGEIEKQYEVCRRLGAVKWKNWR